MANQQEWTARKANEDIRLRKLKDRPEDSGLGRKNSRKIKCTTISGAISAWLTSTLSISLRPHSTGVGASWICSSTKRKLQWEWLVPDIGLGFLTPAPQATRGVSVFEGCPSPWLPVSETLNLSASHFNISSKLK